jgi:hypothetical protein
MATVFGEFFIRTVTCESKTEQEPGDTDEIFFVWVAGTRHNREDDCDIHAGQTLEKNIKVTSETLADGQEWILTVGLKESDSFFNPTGGPVDADLGEALFLVKKNGDQILARCNEASSHGVKVVGDNVLMFTGRGAKYFVQFEMVVEENGSKRSIPITSYERS